jgi:hypothetical protein
MLYLLEKWKGVLKTMTMFRPPAVPLITVDPYFSVWSSSNDLHGTETRHWTGKEQGMVGMAKIDSKVWRFMGGKDRRSDFPSIDAPAMKQIDLKVYPLSSIYTFEAGGVTLTVDFTTPLLPDDLDLLSRPASYISASAKSHDGKPHEVEVYFDITGEHCVDTLIQEVEASRFELVDGSPALKIGTTKQPVLKRSGDDIRIDWGYALLTASATSKPQTVISDARLRDRYAVSGVIDTKDDQAFPRDLTGHLPVLACVINYGTVHEDAVQHFFVAAYDDILAIEYFGKQLPGYWRRNGMTTEELLSAAIREYPVIMSRCSEFNASMAAEAEAAGGSRYADIIALAYRQAVAAHKLIADQDGNVIFLSKENNSNGCIGTVDVSYPSIPLFLLYNVELVKGMVRPIFRYASSEAWPYDFAPHDVGRYPLANGQAYGMTEERQMPIEECGNMLIITAAICLAEGNPDFAADQWDLLTQWSHYLEEFGMDPGNQLCTDDFGGHLAHNTNLSIKAIIGIASYGILCTMRGDKTAGEQHVEKARAMAVQWEMMAREGDHYKLAFDASDSWSMKYNLVWDSLLGLNIFPAKIRKSEIAYYLTKNNKYGLPLDNRQTYTKADWLLWVAAMAERREDFDALVNPLWDFLNESPSRAPFTDWYYTVDGRMVHFINRSVVGGLFIKMLTERGMAAVHK